jgi:sulfur carrier protein
MIFVNSKPLEFIPNTKLNTLLEQIGIVSRKGIAVAVHDEVISSKDWQNYVLNVNDKITIIKATQGG